MFMQLGPHIFDKAFTPDGYDHTDETTYAEHALINAKPRLQPTGNNAEEITFNIKLRAELVDMRKTYVSLKKSKDEFEVLPLIMGNSEYKGDFVMTSLQHSIISALPDGTPVEIMLSIALKEFVVADKLAQQQVAARKQAFASGDKQPVRSLAPQQHTEAKQSIDNIGLTNSHSTVVDATIRQYDNNPTAQPSLDAKIKYHLSVIDTLLNTTAQKVTNITLLPNADVLAAAINNVRAIVPNFVFPTTVTDLRTNNLNLQAAMQALQISSSPLFNLVTTRTA